MTFDLGARNDLDLPGRCADGVLLLLQMSYILIDGRASGERHDSCCQENQPHRNRLLPIGAANSRAPRKPGFFCGVIRAVRYMPFFLRSAQRLFIAIDSRRLPSAVKPPRLRFFDMEPLGLPPFLLPPPDKADPSSAVIALPSLSLSFFKSATNLSRSKVLSFGEHAIRNSRLFGNRSLCFASYMNRSARQLASAQYLAYLSAQSNQAGCRISTEQARSPRVAIEIDYN
jgi:hypothetical protein